MCMDHDHICSGEEHIHHHDHCHDHEHHHEHQHDHEHHDHCHGECGGCAGCEHTPMEELMALMKYMVGHNASHAQELANLAKQLDEAGEHVAYEQTMQAVSDFEKGNMRLSTVLAALSNQEG